MPFRAKGRRKSEKLNAETFLFSVLRSSSSHAYFSFCRFGPQKKTISCIHSLTSIDVIAFAIQASICVDLGSLSFIASNGKKSTQWLHIQTQWGIKRTMTAHSLSPPTIPSAKIEPHMIDSHVFQSIFYASLICVCADFENCVSSSILFPCNQLHAFSLQFFFVSIKTYSRHIASKDSESFENPQNKTCR